MSTNYHKEFEFDTFSLSSSEQEVLPRLIKASELIGSLFALQENEELPGANFYPSDTTAAEIEEAGKENPLILDHYTVVERNDDGLLVAVPYHEKYKEQMEPIAALLDEASAISENPSFSRFLKARAQSFRDDSWDASEDLWLDVEDSKLDILIGPIEPYLDNILSVKYAFQSNVRVKSDDPTFNPQDYLRVVRYLHTASPMVSDEEEQRPVRVRVDDVVCLSGRHAKLPPRGTNLPNDSQKVARLGTKLIIYATNIKFRDGGLLVPVFENVFGEGFRMGYSKEEILSAAVRLTMLHEITEAVVKYPDTVARLKDLYLPVKELHASVIGIKSCTFHVLKGVLTQKDYEEILLILLCRTFSDWLIRESSQDLMHYIKGYVVAFNFFKECGALVVEHGLITPDFEKMFVAVEGLSNTLSHLMSCGTREEAQQFFDQYGSFELFEEFAPRLEGITVEI